MSKRHGIAYFAFRTLEENSAQVIQDIASEAEYHLHHKLISHTEIQEAFVEDNKVIVAAYLEKSIDDIKLQDELAPDMDYGFVCSDDSGKEYRMEMVESSFHISDL